MDDVDEEEVLIEPRFKYSRTLNDVSKFVGFGGAPDGEGGDATPNQQRMAAARKVFDALRQRLRPWSTEFFAFSKFGWPPSIVGVVPRIKHNLQYFTTNYLCLVVILLIYCILTSFLMLLTLIVLGGLIYTIYNRTQKGPVVLAGQEVLENDYPSCIAIHNKCIAMNSGRIYLEWPYGMYNSAPQMCCFLHFHRQARQLQYQFLGLEATNIIR
ncbi:PRA1 family protein [Ditylenchus destructor]|nr:PRA1 family protein [Ditylenchus destructor]